MKTCPQCQTAHDDGNKFCQGCGAALAEVVASAGPPPPRFTPSARPPIRPAKRKTALVAGAALVLLLALGGVGYWWLSDQAPVQEGKLYVDKGGCPGEGCRYGVWRTTSPVSLRAAPDQKASVVGQVPARVQVEALTGEVHLMPGVIVLQDHLESEAGMAYKPGERLLVLTPLGEGWCKVFYRGRFYKEDVGPMGAGGAPGTKPVEIITWWVQLKAPNGLTGWTDQTRALAGISEFE